MNYNQMCSKCSVLLIILKLLDPQWAKDES